MKEFIRILRVSGHTVKKHLTMFRFKEKIHVRVTFVTESSLTKMPPRQLAVSAAGHCYRTFITLFSLSLCF